MIPATPGETASVRVSSMAFHAISTKKNSCLDCDSIKLVVCLKEPIPDVYLVYIIQFFELNDILINSNI